MKIERTRIHFSATFSLPSPSSDLKVPNRELKQHQRRRLRKRHLKNEVALLQTLSRLFYLVQFVKYWQFLRELKSKRLYRSLGGKKEVVVLCSCPPHNVKLGIFTLHSYIDGKTIYKNV